MASTQLIPTYTAPTRRDPSIRPTRETYHALQEAYDHFNGELFDDDLPNCIITLKRKNRSYGSFSGKRFISEDGRECDEIALNPARFQERSLVDTLGTLAHEMVHLWRLHHGKPGRGSYHNRQWASMMKQVGLYPSSTGAGGGQETGDKVSHYIVSGGRFIRAMDVLERRGFSIPWAEVPVIRPETAGTMEGTNSPTGAKSGIRVKYICPVCALNALSRHDAKISCLAHGVQMLPE